VNRSTGSWLAGGAAALVLAGVLAFLLLNRDGAPAASLSPSASATPEVTPGATLNEELLNSRLTVLLLGLDSNAARRERGTGLNTDTIMLASVSADQSEVTLVSLPRDTVDLPMPDGRTWDAKVNAIYATEGVETLVGTMEELYQVPIDGYALIDMDDMAALVDAARGVRVSPPEPLVDPVVKLDIPAGPQRLDGKTAMAYMRSRADTDYNRAGRQQEVLQVIMRRLLRPDTDVDVAEFFSGLRSFETDLPLDDLPTLLEIVRRARDAEVTGEVLGPPEYILFEGDRGDGRGYVIQPNIEAIRAFIAEHITDE
jgi:LCP family protein required for cell wall assembly